MDFVEDIQMKDFDFGYFGIGDEGYAQYKTAFDRIFDTSDSQDSFDSDSDFSLDEDAEDSDF